MSTQTDYFAAEGLRKDLKGRTVRGGLYTMAAQGSVALLGLATVPIMARLLDPADFGLVAMVTVFTGFAAMFVDAGLSMATIQRDDINHQQVSNLFWVATVLGIAIAAVVALAAPAIAWFYREPRLIPITLALSISFIFSGLTIQPQALLRRAMRLKALAVIQVVSFSLSYAIAIAVAWHFQSYWALVLLPITAAFLRMTQTWIACGWWPSAPRRGVGMRNLVGFGANLTGFSFVNYFARNADNMLIGWWWGDAPLGFYERGYKLMMAPLTQINAPLAQLMIPVLSRLQKQPDKYRDAYFQAVGLLQVIACPLMAFVAVTAPWIVDVVFGPGWEEVGPILRWLAIAGFIQPLSNSLGWLYISQGRTHELMRWGIVGCTIIVLAFAVGLSWGPIGVARAYAITTYVFIVPLGYWYAGASGPINARDFVKLSASALLFVTPTVVVAALLSARYAHATSALGLCLTGMASLATTFTVFAGTGSGRIYIARVLKLLSQTFRQRNLPSQQISDSGKSV